MLKDFSITKAYIKIKYIFKKDSTRALSQLRERHSSPSVIPPPRFPVSAKRGEGEVKKGQDFKEIYLEHYGQGEREKLYHQRNIYIGHKELQRRRCTRAMRFN